MRTSAKRWPSVLSGDLVLVWGLVALAWGVMLTAALTGQDHWLHHDALIEHNPQPLAIKLLIFLVAWQVMMAGMMLPTVMPLLRHFRKATRQQAGERYSLASMGVFLLVYLWVWTIFALIVFLGDMGLHQLVHRFHWLEHRPWLIGGITFLLVGAFQFTPLKRRCMQACHHPATFLAQHDRMGPWANWLLGVNHGLSCLGCCGGLMLAMFAVGVGHFFWMVGLTLVMVLEKTSRWNQAIASTVGIAFLSWGGLTLLKPLLSPAAQPLHHHH